MTRTLSSLLFFAILNFSLLPCAQGHGYLAIPKSRNFLHNSNYCPHCLNGGDPNGRNIGVCGDPADGPHDHENGGKYATGTVTGVYKPGGYMHVAVGVSTYHKGVVEYRVCKYRAGSAREERKAITEECFKKNVLRQAYVKGSQRPGSTFQFLGNATEQIFRPVKLFYATYKIPKTLECDGKKYKCVLQMKWVTGNRCNIPGIPTNYRLNGLEPCGRFNLYPEVFNNCADIRIKASANTNGYPYSSAWPVASGALRAKK